MQINFMEHKTKQPTFFAWSLVDLTMSQISNGKSYRNMWPNLLWKDREKKSWNKTINPPQAPNDI